VSDYSVHKADFDLNRFVQAIDASRSLRGVTWLDISRVTGVSTTTLSRMKEGRQPDAASLAALSAWSGINPANFMARKPPTRRPTMKPPLVPLRNMEADRHEDDTDNWW
jgi:transcriptional regulator with XRE-family HTH domain